MDRQIENVRIVVGELLNAIAVLKQRKTERRVSDESSTEETEDQYLTGTYMDIPVQNKDAAGAPAVNRMLRGHGNVVEIAKA
jgi:hypothetical protein